MKRILLATVVVLLFHLAGRQPVAAADRQSFLDEVAGKSDDFIWRTDDPSHRPNLMPAIWYALTWQGIAFGGLHLLDSEETGFSNPSFRNLRNAFERGTGRDDDKWYWNYVAHPLWGSETYLRARSQGFHQFPSFLFSTACSVVWEFGFESWSARPSAEDLLITSTAGSLIGELRFHLKRRLALNDSKSAKVLDFITDPLHGVTRAVGGLFGQDWREPAYERVVAQEQRNSSVTLDFAVIDKKPGVMVRMGWRF